MAFIPLCILSQDQFDEASQYLHLGSSVILDTFMLTEEDPQPLGGVQVSKEHLRGHLSREDVSSADMQCTESVSYLTLHGQSGSVAFAPDPSVGV